jgi:hypothetical protein
MTLRVTRVQIPLPAPLQTNGRFILAVFIGSDKFNPAYDFSTSSKPIIGFILNSSVALKAVGQVCHVRNCRNSFKNVGVLTLMKA